MTPRRTRASTGTDGVMNPIKVLIIDDSALTRQLLTEIIGRQPDLRVVGAAPDPLAATEMIRTLAPDVLTLDVEMPKMDGLEFLERLMRQQPMPVVMVSGFTEEGAEATLRALELGAVDFVSKPGIGSARGMKAFGAEVVDKIRSAAQARIRRAGCTPAAPPAPAPAVPHLFRIGSERLIVIGSSTGGTEALRVLLAQLPPNSPGVLVTQHMPPGFTRTFAERLDGLCHISVKEAHQDERVLPGHAYIAPGDRHLKLGRSGTHYVTLLEDGPPVNRHRPSVDVLFRSAARHAGPNALGVMLTGMGRDGALAMREMREAGAFNVAQDEASCVVFGMPKEAIAVGAVHEVLPLDQIAGCLVRHLSLSGAAGVPG